jgi:hypothetical protein
MNIVLVARQNYAGCITEGNRYVPLAQTKTGFLIKGDDNVEIDLYIHFFKVGCQNKDEEYILPEKTQKEKFVIETISISEEKPKKEVAVKVPPIGGVPHKIEKEKIVQPKENSSPIDHLIDEDDDF